jgi:Cft2 family RNA processing exonuclease
VGYADPDTPAGRLKAAKQGQTFFFSNIGGNLKKKCQVEDFDLTAHADKFDMLHFIGRVRPKIAILGHGSDISRGWFQEQI